MTQSIAPYRPYIAMLLLFSVVLVGTVLILQRPAPATLTLVTPTPRPTSTPAVVIVDVRGAVAHPGVYTLAAGSRVQDVIAQAGSTLPGADLRGLNLARRLNDGEQIYVYAVGEPALSPPPGSESTRPGAASSPSGPASVVNVNTATLEQFDTLPGIGPAIAQRIIDYRTQNGPFVSVDDLKNVRGIGDVLFGQIKDWVTVQ
jgi:competence protein ComEA